MNKMEKTLTSHDEEISRLKRIEGQIRGIQQMVEQKRYCIDIMTQLAAAIGALKRVEENILVRHLKGCVKASFNRGTKNDRQQKVNEVIEVLKMFRKCKGGDRMNMKYYFNAVIEGNFDDVENRVRKELKKEGFGVLTEIDVGMTLKKKLDVDFRPYKILGACNPEYAYQALLAEDKIGTMLPCSVIVQEVEAGKIEVAAIDPIASMQAIQRL